MLTARTIGDEGNAGYAVGFEAICARPNGIARVIARAISDDTWVACVVFLDLEDNLHQVGANVRDFGEDTARHA